MKRFFLMLMSMLFLVAFAVATNVTNDVKVENSGIVVYCDVGVQGTAINMINMIVPVNGLAAIHQAYEGKVLDEAKLQTNIGNKLGVIVLNVGLITEASNDNIQLSLENSDNQYYSPYVEAEYYNLYFIRIPTEGVVIC